MNPVETWIAYEYQVNAKDPTELAEELGIHRSRVPRLLSELGIGTPEMLAKERPDILINEHGSIDKASEATGISRLKITRARDLQA